MADQPAKKTDNRPPQLRRPRGPRKSTRQQFLDRYISYVKYARRGLRRLAKLGNPRWNQYTAEEAAAILKVVREDMNDIERAFKGTPREKGIFDL